jgi:ketosteroid isomerase-like protein
MSELDRNEVLAAHDAFYRAFEKRDLQAMNLVWWQGSGSLCVHPGGEILQGWQDVRQSWQQIFQNTDYLEIDAELVSIEVGDRLAYVVASEKVLQVVGNRKFQARSLATNVFQKMAQKWYMVHHHASPIMR